MQESLGIIDNDKKIPTTKLQSGLPYKPIRL